MNRTLSGKLEKGFTLVELLVVIGIIALLVSILLPSLNKARTTANAAACLSNLRQIGMALNIYLQDSKGTMPVPPRNFTYGSVAPVLFARIYANPPLDFGAKHTFRCPSQWDGEPTVSGSSLFALQITETYLDKTYKFTCDYAFNEGTWHWFERPPTPSGIYDPTLTKITNVKRSADIIYAIDGRGSIRIDNNSTSTNMTLVATNMQTGEINTHTILRHGGKNKKGMPSVAQALFFDGHAAPLDPWMNPPSAPITVPARMFDFRRTLP